MPSLLTTHKPRDPLTAAEVRALRAIRQARRQSLRAMALEIGVPLVTLQALLTGPSVTAAARLRIRAFLALYDERPAGQEVLRRTR